MLLKHEGFRRLCLARDLILDSDAAWSIADVARLVGVSPFHFIRQFEAVFGQTPHQFRIEARLDRAKRLLATGEQSVTDVCMEVGFSSLGSFSALFRRRVGETPSVFRRRLRATYAQPRARSAALAPGCLSLMNGLGAPRPVPAAISEKLPAPTSRTMPLRQRGGRYADQAHEHHG
jgi:AraC-like DNA-binding protein